MLLLSFMVFLYTDLPLSSPRLQAIENHFSALNTFHNPEQWPYWNIGDQITDSGLQSWTKEQHNFWNSSRTIFCKVLLVLSWEFKNVRAHCLLLSNVFQRCIVSERNLKGKMSGCIKQSLDKTCWQSRSRMKILTWVVTRVSCGDSEEISGSLVGSGSEVGFRTW